jgi:TonB family protein
VFAQTQDASVTGNLGPQAVKFILKNFTINPAAADPNTNQPLQTNGSWSIGKSRPASCPATGQNCVEVFYSVPAQAAKCSWVVALNADGGDGAVLDENDDAAKYMLREIGGKDAKPFVKSRSKPVYPPIAMAAHVSGDVTLSVLVDASGAVHTIRVASGPPMLQQASVDAAKKWTFKPMTIGARAVPYDIQLVFTFQAVNVQWGIVKMTP